MYFETVREVALFEIHFLCLLNSYKLIAISIYDYKSNLFLLVFSLTQISDTVNY